MVLPTRTYLSVLALLVDGWLMRPNFIIVFFCRNLCVPKVKEDVHPNQSPRRTMHPYILHNGGNEGSVLVRTGLGHNLTVGA